MGAKCFLKSSNSTVEFKVKPQTVVSPAGGFGGGFVGKEFGEVGALDSVTLLALASTGLLALASVTLLAFGSAGFVAGFAAGFASGLFAGFVSGIAGAEFVKRRKQKERLNS